MTDGFGGVADEPEWLRWEGVEALEADRERAERAIDAGEIQEARDLLRSVFERAVVAPRLPSGWLMSLTADLERVLGFSRSDVAEAIALFSRAEEATPAPTEDARAHALAMRARFIGEVADTDHAGEPALMLLADFADETSRTFGTLRGAQAAADLIEVDRARIAMGLRTDEYASEERVFAAFDAAIASAAGRDGQPESMAYLRLVWDAAQFARSRDAWTRATAGLDELDRVAAAVGPDADDVRWRVAGVRVAIVDESRADVALLLSAVEAFNALPGGDSVLRVAVHGAVARTVAERLTLLGRAPDARAVEDRLLLRFVTAADPAVRVAAAQQLRWSAAGSESDGSTWTAPERDRLRRAVAAFEGDDDPDVRREVDATAVQLGAAEIHLGDERAGVTVLTEVLRRLDTRDGARRRGRVLGSLFSQIRRLPEPAEPDTAQLRRRANLALALAYDGLGETTASYAALDAVAAGTPSNHPDAAARAIRAEAAYWRSRFARERGAADHLDAVARLVDDAADDTDATVRVWASGALMSLWMWAKDRDDAARAWALDTHAERFPDDEDPTIRAREVARMSARAQDLRTAGDLSAAQAVLDQVFAQYGDDTDHPEIAARVQAAWDLREMWRALAADTGAPVASQAGPSLSEVDAVIAEGNRLARVDPGAACAAYVRAADLSRGSANVYVRVSGVVALDNLTTTVLDVGDIPALAREAERLVLECDHVRTMEMPPLLARRIDGIRALGLYRWAIALGRLSDRARALHLYGLVAHARHPSEVTDDEHITAVSQAMYNRAVLLDEAGDLPAAVDAYQELFVAHRYWPDTVPRRIRVVKALRNRGIALEQLGRIPDAADAYRSAAELCQGSTDADLHARFADSWERFASLGMRAGMHGDVITWIDAALADPRRDPSQDRRLVEVRKTASKGARRR